MTEETPGCAAAETIAGRRPITLPTQPQTGLQVSIRGLDPIADQSLASVRAKIVPKILPNPQRFDAVDEVRVNPSVVCERSSAAAKVHSDSVRVRPQIGPRVKRAQLGSVRNVTPRG